MWKTEDLNIIPYSPLCTPIGKRLIYFRFFLLKASLSVWPIDDFLLKSRLLLGSNLDARILSHPYHGANNYESKVMRQYR